MGFKEYLHQHSKLVSAVAILFLLQFIIVIFVFLKKPDTTLGRIESQIGTIAEVQKEIKTDLKGIHQELKNLSTADSIMNAQLKYYPAAVPTSGNITSYYQKRKDPQSGEIIQHTGVDLRAPIGTPVYATADGYVEKTIWSNDGYGNEILLNHQNGYKSLYGHLSKIEVIPNQVVHRGTEIGKTGNSGKSTGPHLHYEILYNEKKINPSIFRQQYKPSSLLSLPQELFSAL